MKHRYHFFSIMLFLFSSFFYAMECEKKLNSFKKLDIIGEIPTGNDLLCVRTIDDNRAIVFNREKYSSIINFRTNQEIKKLSDFEKDFYFKIVLRFNNKKIFSRTYMALLDTMKREIEEWYNTSQMSRYVKSIMFSPHEEVLYFCYGNKRDFITKYDHRVKKYNDIPIGHSCCLMMMNSKEKMVYMIDSDKNVVSAYEVDHLEYFKSLFTFPETQSYFYLYSFQGYYLAMSDLHNVFIKDLSKNCAIWNSLEEKKPRCMLIHPNGSVLIALLAPSAEDCKQISLMRCWDIKTREIICTREFDCTDGIYEFDISHDGLEFIFKQSDKCIRAAAPFEMLYTAEKEKILYRLCALQHLINQQRTFQNVPKDIERFCAQLLLQAFKR